MSGIYVHIPFCKQKCSYCDFHFSTNKRVESEMVASISIEIRLKKDLIKKNSIETIYFGGGSPSFIETENIGKIINEIRNHYSVLPNAEITIECNPDDISTSFLNSLKGFGVNRISLGIQSFFDDDLTLLNRAHSSSDAIKSVEKIKEVGIENITIDLIYGLPNSTLKKWQENVAKAIQLEVPHISAYCLTVEDKTLLKHQVDHDLIQIPQESDQLDQFKYLVKELIKNGYDHYEISNFAKEGFISKHNSSYWKGKNYLGIGPSAHSKLNNERFWNIANNFQYIKRLNTDKEISENEFLNEKDMFNELIMISLRTKWGLSIQELKKSKYFDANFQKELQKLKIEGRITIENDRIYIVGENKFIADTIISNLFIV